MQARCAVHKTPRLQVLNRAAARGEMALEPVAMQINDARQDTVACQINCPAGAVLNNETFGDRQLRFYSLSI